MPAYRTYFIDQNNSISAPAKIIECAGDFDAIDKAKQLVDGHDVELWEGDRLVIRFFHDPRKSKEFSNMATISHKERAERLFRWKQDPVKALSESATKEQATRVLTAKLRVERLAREARLVAKTRTSRGTTHDDAKSPPF